MGERRSRACCTEHTGRRGGRGGGELAVRHGCCRRSLGAPLCAVLGEAGVHTAGRPLHVGGGWRTEEGEGFGGGGRARKRAAGTGRRSAPAFTDHALRGPFAVPLAAMVSAAWTVPSRPPPPPATVAGDGGLGPLTRSPGGSYPPPRPPVAPLVVGVLPVQALLPVVLAKSSFHPTRYRVRPPRGARLEASSKRRRPVRTPSTEPRRGDPLPSSSTPWPPPAPLTISPLCPTLWPAPVA